MSKVRCPICEGMMDAHGPKEWPDWPFCSKRCRMADLGRWLGGAYRIDTPLTEEDLDELTQSPETAAPSADPHREEA